MFSIKYERGLRYYILGLLVLVLLTFAMIAASMVYVTTKEKKQSNKDNRQAEFASLENKKEKIKNEKQSI